MAHPKPRHNELLTRKNKLNQEIGDFDVQIRELQQQQALKQKELNRVSQQLQQIEQKKPITVSDHAVVQFLTRTGRLDVEAVRAELLTDELQRLVNTLGGTGTFPIPEGRVVLQSHTIVTFLTAD